MATETCPRCGSEELNTTPTPETQHHAKLECRDCGRWIRWLPRPAATAMPAVVRPPGERPATLEWTSDAQVAAALSIRSRMLRECQAAARRDVADVVASVTDPTWFLANRNRPIAGMRWPSPTQMERPR